MKDHEDDPRDRQNAKRCSSYFEMIISLKELRCRSNMKLFMNTDDMDQLTSFLYVGYEHYYEI